MPDFSFITDVDVRTKAEATYAKDMETLQSSIDAKILEATTGLKVKNDELLTEKKKIQLTLKNFENIDPAAAREALKFLEENEDAKLIKEGKIEELLDKKTTSMRTQHEELVNALQTNLSEKEKAAQTYKEKYESKVIEDNLREVALAAGVRPEALTDITLRGRNVFSLDDKYQLEARTADGKLAKTADDKVLNPVNWLEGLKKTSPHYWPMSEGAGAFSHGRMSEYSEALATAAEKGDMTSFRKLRAARGK